MTVLDRSKSAPSPLHRRGLLVGIIAASIVPLSGCEGTPAMTRAIGFAALVGNLAQPFAGSGGGGCGNSQMRDSGGESNYGLLPCR